MTETDILAFARSKAGLAAAREFVSGAHYLDNLIAMRLSRLDAVRSRATQVGRALSGMPGSGNIADRMGDAAAELADLEQELLADYHALLAKQKEIGAAIRRIPDERYAMVLEMRYLQQRPFPRIAIALSYDERQIYRFHEKGLRHIAAQIAAGEVEMGDGTGIIAGGCF